MDLSSDYTSWPSDETVREIVQKYISDNALGLPFSSLKVSYEQLSKSNEYSSFVNFDSVELGDYVTVEYGALLSGPQKVRCTKISYDVLLDKINSIDLGSESTLTDSISQQQSALSSSTNYTREYVQEQLSNITYDTALSTTSENAVQNKVVTKAINNTNDQITNIRGDISNIITQIEGLTPGTGSITYGYSLPTGGSDGDAYVQLTSTPKDPRATVSVSPTHKNFEVTNFTKSGDKYSFDISGTVEEGSVNNYALVNVENLRAGSEYKVKMHIAHNVANADTGVSYSYDRWSVPNNRYTKAFGIFIGNKNAVSNYPGNNFTNNWIFAPSQTDATGTSRFCPTAQFQPLYRDVSDLDYDFYFTASSDSASFSFIFDDLTDELSCNCSVTDLEITYVGVPKVIYGWSANMSAFAKNAYNDNYEASQGITDRDVNPSWTIWAGYVTDGDTYIGLTFTEPQEMDRVRLSQLKGDSYLWPDTTLRYAYIEASTDDKVWNDSEKEWINIGGSNDPIELHCTNEDTIKHWIDVDKGTYNNIRVRFVNSTNGEMESIQCYLREETVPENHVKDLFFKCDGEWLVYPRDEDDGETFGYGTEDPTEDTQNDIYAKLIEGSEPDTYDIDSILYKVDSNWLLGPSGGSGGGGITRDTIWTGTASVSSGNNTTSKPITNYDLLLIYHVDMPNTSTDEEAHLFLVDPQRIADKNYAVNQWGGNFEYSYYSGQYIRGSFSDSTTFSMSSGSSGGIIVRIDGLKFSGGGGGSASDDYSTTETRIGTWIDGKPLYRCCYDAGSYVGQIDWDVSALNVSLITRSECLVADVADASTITGVISCTTNREMYMTPQKVIHTTGGYYKRYIIIEYTKTTD